MPAKTATPVQPVNTAVKAATPVEPVQPAQPATVAVTSVLPSVKRIAAVQAQPAEAIATAVVPVTAVNPVAFIITPVQAATPATPATPVAALKPVTTVSVPAVTPSQPKTTQPAQPMQPKRTYPAQSAQPAQPAQPVKQPTQPAQPARAQSTKSAKLVQEWLDLAEKHLKQLKMYKKIGLLDWKFVKTAYNSCIAACPSPMLRVRLVAMRDGGVYGSSMMPYLKLLRTLLDQVPQFSHAELTAKVAVPQTASVEPTVTATPVTTNAKVAAKTSKRRVPAPPPSIRKKNKTSKTTPQTSSTATKHIKNGAVVRKRQPSALPKKKIWVSPSKLVASSSLVTRPAPKATPDTGTSTKKRFFCFTKLLGIFFASANQTSRCRVEDVQKIIGIQGVFRPNEVQANLELLHKENRVMLTGTHVWAL